MLFCLTRWKEPAISPAQSSGEICSHKRELQDEILIAIREVSALLSQQTQAVIDGDPDFGRFDILLQMAQQRKELAKYAWMSHVESHRCE